MPRPTLLNTSAINLRTLLSNGKRYEVPPYQSDYSWGEEQWEALWLDLEGIENGDQQHYMGALVLQEYAPDQYRIIDGQQRLATLSILVIASLHCLQALIDRGREPEANRERADLLRARGELRSATEVKAALQPIYVSDDEFREQFAKAAINAAGARKKLVRYILCTLERHMHNVDLDFESTNASIEHILPERPSPAWQDEFPPEVHARYVHRLGNYLLLEPKLNRERAANGSLEEKKAAYAQSQYPATRAFDWDAWTPRTIEERQASMARIATSAWRLP